MRKAAVVILWATLSAANAGAQQVCPDGIPQATPTADFTDHGDGTLTHNRTGLIWKKCVEGLSGTDCATGTVSWHTWQTALQLADGHSFAGYGDWRLPNIKELASIIERSCYSPAINLSVFPNDPGLWIYSSSPSNSHSGSAWGVYFDDGDDAGDGGLSHQVRLVRGGQ